MANSAFTHDPQITVPASSTDNAVVIFDGTSGSGFGNSTIIVDSGGNGRIGIAADVDLLTLASGALTVNGTIAATGFTIGSAVLIEAELELLDDVTAGTAIASKVVTTDSNIDTTGQRNLTISGELDAATGDFSGAVDVAGAFSLAGTAVTSTAAELNLLDALDRGSILYGNASGVTTVLGQGGADTVLTSDGTDISWQAAGGGNLVLINTAVADNSAICLTITGLDSTYDSYLLVGSDLVNASDNADAYMRFGDSGGLDGGASDYGYYGHGNRTNGTSDVIFQNGGASFIKLNSGGIGGSTGEGWGFNLTLHRPGDGVMRPGVSGTFVYHATDTVLSGGQLIGGRNAVITLDRVQIFASCGNLESGRFSVYGIKHT